MDKIWPVQEAKARLSELLRAAENEPQQISFRGEPKFEVRLLPHDTKRKTTVEGSLPRWWLNAPKAAGLKLPPRKREKTRKVF
jgi:prevent-host-death family protein